VKDTLAILALRLVAEIPDLAAPVCDIVQMMGAVCESERAVHYTRLRGTLKGVDTNRLSAADAYAALKVQVDDLKDHV
jgi:hypothetical protein